MTIPKPVTVAQKRNDLISQTWVAYPLLVVEKGMKETLTKTIRALREKNPKLSLLTYQTKPRNSMCRSLRVD